MSHKLPPGQRIYDSAQKELLTVVSVHPDSRDASLVMYDGSDRRSGRYTDEFFNTRFYLLDWLDNSLVPGMDEPTFSVNMMGGQIATPEIPF
jgi:hypothetical protein